MFWFFPPNGVLFYFFIKTCYPFWKGCSILARIAFVPPSPNTFHKDRSALGQDTDPLALDSSFEGYNSSNNNTNKDLLVNQSIYVPAITDTTTTVDTMMMSTIASTTTLD
jgi:hypothetical protein